MNIYYQQKAKFIKNEKQKKIYQPYLIPGYLKSGNIVDDGRGLRYSNRYEHEWYVRDFVGMWSRMSYHERLRFVKNGSLTSKAVLKYIVDILGFGDNPYSDFINRICLQ